MKKAIKWLANRSGVTTEIQKEHKILVTQWLSAQLRSNHHLFDAPGLEKFHGKVVATDTLNILGAILEKGNGFTKEDMATMVRTLAGQDRERWKERMTAVGKHRKR